MQAIRFVPAGNILRVPNGLFRYHSVFSVYCCTLSYARSRPGVGLAAAGVQADTVKGGSELWVTIRKS